MALPAGTRLGPHDVSSDGQRILINRPIDEESTPPITLVQNWTALLKSR